MQASCEHVMFARHVMFAQHVMFARHAMFARLVRGSHLPWKAGGPCFTSTKVVKVVRLDTFPTWLIKSSFWASKATQVVSKLSCLSKLLLGTMSLGVLLVNTASELV